VLPAVAGSPSLPDFEGNAKEPLKDVQCIEPTQTHQPTRKKRTTGKSDAIASVVQEPSTAIAPVMGERTKKKHDDKTDGSKVWDAYSASMQRHWGMTPPRSAKTSALAKQLVDLVGVDQATRIATYYPSRRDRYYVAKGHPFGIVVSDHMKLLREITSGYKMCEEIVTHFVEGEQREESKKLHENEVIVNPLLMDEDEYIEYRKRKELVEVQYDIKLMEG
jgi:hypothetical protein